MAMTTLGYDVNGRSVRAPEAIAHTDVCAVGVDSRDRVYVATHHPNLVIRGHAKPRGRRMPMWHDTESPHTFLEGTWT